MASPYLEKDDHNYDEIQMLKLEVVLNEKKNEKFTLIGQSIAGTRTSIVIPELGICLDYGFCSLIGTQQQMVLITHGHADHVGSLHFSRFRPNDARYGNTNLSNARSLFAAFCCWL